MQQEQDREQQAKLFLHISVMQPWADMATLEKISTNRSGTGCPGCNKTSHFKFLRAFETLLKYRLNLTRWDGRHLQS